MKREIFNYLVSKRITPLIFHSRSDTLRRPRQSFIPQNDELQFGGEDLLDSAATASTSSSSKKSAASEQIQVRLEFPGNEYQRPKRSQLASGQYGSSSFMCLGWVLCAIGGLYRLLNVHTNQREKWYRSPT